MSVSDQVIYDIFPQNVDQNRDRRMLKIGLSKDAEGYEQGSAGEKTERDVSHQAT